MRSKSFGARASMAIASYSLALIGLPSCRNAASCESISMSAATFRFFVISAFLWLFLLVTVKTRWSSCMEYGKPISKGQRASAEVAALLTETIGHNLAPAIGSEVL